MEAWLYGGPESTLCGRGAGAFWEMGTFPDIDLAFPGYRRGTGRIHFRRYAIAENEWVTREGLRVTTPARTLLDLTGLIPLPHLQRVFTEAEVLGHVDQPAIARLLAAHPVARGAMTLAGLAGIDRGATRRGRVRFRFEIRYRSLVERTDLDVPIYNHRIEAAGHVYVLDAFQEHARVAVEVDGRPAHEARERLSTDKERDRHLLTAGIRTVRLTEQHFADEAGLVEDLVAIVGRRRGQVAAPT